MDMASLNIIVVGAGIGGLAAALAARRLGARVTVLEQANEIAEVGAGLQITPNGVAVMQALGIADDLAWCSQRARAVVLRNHRQGRQVMRLDLDQYAHDLRYYFVHRADLINILLAAAREVGVVIKLSQSVENVTWQADGRAVVNCTNAPDRAADLIIGADGVRSKVAASLRDVVGFTKSEPFFTGQVAWRAVVPNSIGLEAEAQVFMGPNRHIVAYPLKDGSMVNLVAVQERKAWAEESWSLRDDPKNLHAAFSMFGGQAAQLLERVDAPALWGLFRHPVAKNWSHGTVALLGDAAHPTLPFMAQGANMALEDAYVLADSLRRSNSISGALQRYQTHRRARVVDVVEAANKNAWRYHLRAPVSWPAHLIMQGLGHYAPQRLVQQFDWIYRHDVTAV